MLKKCYHIFFLFIIFQLCFDYIFCKKFLIVNQVTFSSDIPVSKEEILYLTGLRYQKEITYDQLEKCKQDLLLKKRFISVDIKIDPTKDGCNLHFTLVSNWLFNKVSISGIWFGKHRYVNLYEMQPGDIFDIDVHSRSIKSIKKYLFNHGYFNCVVRDELIYDKSNKTIVAKIFIDRNCKFVITDIEFEFQGLLDNLNLNHLFKRVRLKLLSKNYSRSIIKKEVIRIKNKLKQQGFVNCSVSLKRIIDKTNCKLNLIVKIKLGKKIKYSFVGNSFFTDKQIRRDLLELDYPSWFCFPEILCDQLAECYRQNGYLDIEINYKEKNDGSVVFSIQEHNPVSIKNLVIKDENGKELNLNFCFYDFLNKKHYDQNLLQKGVDHLKELFVKDGFWDFEVLDKKIVYLSKKDNECELILFVKKGKQRFLEKIAIDEFRHLENKGVFKKLKKLKNEKSLIPFNQKWLSEQQSFLLNYFQKKGYWYVFVKPNFVDSVFDKNKLRTSVLWSVLKGHKVRFGKVIVDGDTRLPFNKILREVQFKKGDLWDYKKIEKSRQMLKRLNVFKYIQFQPHKIAKEEKSTFRPVVINLIDDDPLQARFRLGYFLTSKNFIFKRSSTYKVGSSLVVKNPTNQADKLILNADFTRWERKINADYQIPYPLDISLKNSVLMGKCKLYANKYTHPVQILQSGHAYETIENGLSLGLSNEYNKGYFWGINTGNEWVKIKQVRGDLKFDKHLINKTLPFFFVEPNLIVNKLDDRIDVKNGNLIFFSLKFMCPERKGKSFTKLMFEDSFFKAIYKDVILGARIRFGHIFNQKFNQVIPNERFYLGGPYSVRGYEKDSLPPVGILKTVKPDGTVHKEYTIQGGNSMINGNLELRFPIYKSFRGVVFQDIGILSQSGFPGFKGAWYPSTGFGLRYKTPIGALRFDIGWKWKHRLPGDGAYAWYLTFGEAF